MAILSMIMQFSCKVLNEFDRNIIILVYSNVKHRKEKNYGYQRISAGNRRL